MKSRRSEADQPAPVLAPVPGHEGDAAGPSDSAYTTIGTGSMWEILSLGCFALTLALRYIPGLDRLFPPPQSLLARFLLPFAAAAGLATIGVVLGLMGSKRSHRPGLARIGIFLNSVVLILVGLFLLAILFMLR